MDPSDVIISHILGTVKRFYARDFNGGKIFTWVRKKSENSETFFEKPIAFFAEVWYNIPRCTGV